jgi:hypothetical protein
MSVAPVVLSDSHDVHTRLSELGLTEEVLLEAARSWHLAWTNFTIDHPPAGVGISAWTESFGVLRRQLASSGWQRSDRANYSLIVSPDGTVAINVASGDSGTGLVGCTPSNKARRGVSTADAVSANRQQLELDLPVPDLPHTRGEDGPMTWFLLLYRSDTEIRAELSLPAGISDGRVTRWQERIILSSISLDDGLTEVPPEGPDLVLDVRRRQ